MKMYDLVIIGAGPAGMAAALEAVSHGTSVCLLDEQQSPGGQIYRALQHCDAQRGKILGDDYLYGKSLINNLATIEAEKLFGATVWRIDTDGHITFSINNSARQINARHIILATGALERACPVPGWTLPGVMTVGAAQILMKTSGLMTENAVLAGTGPLLYTVAVQLINAGCPPKAIVDSQHLNNYLHAARHLPAAIANLTAIKKGLGYLRQIKSAGIPFFHATSNLEVEGTSQAEAVRFNRNGSSITIEASAVLLHHGVVPNTQLTQSLRLRHHWNSQQRCFQPHTSEWGTSSVDTISIAGDGGEIGGALNAEAEGRLVALAALASLDLISIETRDQLARPHQDTLKKDAGLRRFLDALYPVPREITAPADNTLVCRCEEVSAGDIRSFVKAGCTGPNQTKAFGRCGMGPCQGRYCSLTVTEILAAENQLSHDEVGSYRIRSPIKPVTLAELASLCK